MKTVKVRMLRDIWSRDGTDHIPTLIFSAGEIVEMPKKKATRLALCGLAVLADSEATK